MLLNVENLTRKYKRGASVFNAVDEVGFSVDRGEFVSIVGRSGSGKSTLLNLIAGLVRPTSGTIRLDGDSIPDFNDQEGSLYRNSKIGYVPQWQSILPNLSVIDNVRLPFYLHKRIGDPTELALSLLEKMGIPHLASEYPAQLSGGELKRVAIARALINSPVLLIADEPTSDLDLQTTRDILRLLSSFSDDGMAILVVTHEPGVSDYCSRTLLMESGKLSEKI